MGRSVRTLVPRSGTRANALQGGARGAAAGSCLHTYIYASGQTRKKPGRGVPSYAHIRFRPEHLYVSGRTRPARGPCRAFHTYMCTSASYIHIHFSFIHTYTLQVRPGKRRACAQPGPCLHAHIYASGRTRLARGPCRAFMHTCALQLHTYIYTSASYILCMKLKCICMYEAEVHMYA